MVSAECRFLAYCERRICGQGNVLISHTAKVGGAVLFLHVHPTCSCGGWRTSYGSGAPSIVEGYAILMQHEPAEILSEGDQSVMFTIKTSLYCMLLTRITPILLE